MNYKKGECFLEMVFEHELETMLYRNLLPPLKTSLKACENIVETVACNHINYTTDYTLCGWVSDHEAAGVLQTVVYTQ